MSWLKWEVTYLNLNLKMCANLIEHIYNTQNRFALTKARRTRAPKRVLFPTLIYSRTGIIDTHSLGLKRGAWGSFSLYYCHFLSCEPPKALEEIKKYSNSNQKWLAQDRQNTHTPWKGRLETPIFYCATSLQTK